MLFVVNNLEISGKFDKEIVLLSVNLIKLKSFFSNNLVVLFFIMFFVYATCGFYLFFYNDLISNTRWDLLYGFDTGLKFIRMYKNSTALLTDGHPLSGMIVPYVKLLQSFIMSPRAVCIVAQSLLASSSVCLFLSCMNKLSSNKILNNLLSLIYAFSFSTLITASIPELYIYSGFLQCLFLYYVLTITQDEQSKITKIQIFLLALLTTLNFGINLINILPSIFLIIYTLWKKYGLDYKSFFKIFANIIACAITLVLVLTYFQKATFRCHTFMGSIVSAIKHEKEHPYAKFVNKLEPEIKLQYTIKGHFIQPLYAMRSELRKRVYEFEGDKNFPTIKTRLWNFTTEQKPIRFVPFLLFLLIPLCFNVLAIKRCKYKSLLLSLFSIVLIAGICNYFFEVKNCFIYSQNHLCYLLMLIALLYLNVPFDDCKRFFCVIIKSFMFVSNMLVLCAKYFLFVLA